jgi:hypothetical protein
MSSLQEAVDGTLGTQAPAPAANTGSVLDAVRQRAAQLGADHSVDLPIPGYDNLVGRYRAISIARFYQVTGGGQLRNPLSDWGVGADALGTALESLYGKAPDGELVTLYESGDPARFDAELATALGLVPDGQSARAVLVALLGGGELGQSRAWSHFLGYQTWLMEGSAQEVADEAAGESSAGA